MTTSMISGMTIAVAGKGGVGKTTFSALLVHALRLLGIGPILAVDADPNSNLGELLGLETTLTVGALRERTFAGPQAERERPAGWDARSWIEYRMQQAVVEGRGYDLLVMGRPEGPGCYCYANSLLREYLQTLASAYRCLVVDNEAGLEHLSRRLCRRADVLFVLDDGSPRARQAAERIVQLAREVELEPAEIVRIINEARAGAGAGVPQTVTSTSSIVSRSLRLRAGSAVHGSGCSFCVPYDPLVAEWDALGRPLVDLPCDSAAVRAVAAIVDRYIPEGEGSDKREP